MANGASSSVPIAIAPPAALTTIARTLLRSIMQVAHITAESAAAKAHGRKRKKGRQLIAAALAQSGLRFSQLTA
jgi:hypothetical protein